MGILDYTERYLERREAKAKAKVKKNTKRVLDKRKTYKRTYKQLDDAKTDFKKIGKGIVYGTKALDRLVDGRPGTSVKQKVTGRSSYSNTQKVLSQATTYNEAVRMWEAQERRGIRGGKIFKLSKGGYGFYTYN